MDNDRRVETVTLFAFDEGEGLSEHVTPYDALIFVLKGEALVTVAGERNETVAEDATILPQGNHIP
jgi:quercetin dioxygenase-like cupin family protein